MDTLLPIIRRARRPLLPPDDPAPAVPPAAIEPPVIFPLIDAPPGVGKASGRAGRKGAKDAAKAAAF